MGGSLGISARHAQQVTQCVLVQAGRAGRKIGELELDFENPTWKSNWDFEEFTVKFTVRFTINFIINNITQKTKSKKNKDKLNKKQNKKQKQKSNSILIYTKTH